METDLLPAASVLKLMATFPPLRRQGVLKGIIGISGKALKGRVTRNPHARLTARESHLARQLDEIFLLATEVMGTEDAAHVWMTSPAFGLDHSVPLDLLDQAEGLEAVRVYLTRMKFGVYC